MDTREAPSSVHSRSPAPPSRQGTAASASASSSAGLKATRASPLSTRDEQRAKLEAWGSEAYVAEDESIRNDYAAEYALTGSRPQNHLRNTAPETRFAEYPKLSALLQHKHRQLAAAAHSVPPTYATVGASALTSTLEQLVPPSRCRFDCIVLSPPREVSYDDLCALPLARWASSPGFVWLWVGSGQPGDGIGLEQGRDLLAMWGYRRCEDIVWLRTNRRNPSSDLEASADSPIFTPTIEHCLMGIRGTVRRSTDSWFVHCNVDTDVIVWEGDEQDPARKPPELQTLVEDFCLGTRRLHLWGSPRSLRRGWLTVGESFATDMDLGIAGEGSTWKATPFNTGAWPLALPQHPESAFHATGMVPLLPFAEELDNLRPKSPPGRDGQASSGGLGRGRGAGLGVTRSAAALAASSGGPAGRGRGRGRISPAGPQYRSPYGSPSPAQHSSYSTSPSTLPPLRWPADFAVSPPPMPYYAAPMLPPAQHHAAYNPRYAYAPPYQQHTPQDMAAYYVAGWPAAQPYAMSYAPPYEMNGAPGAPQYTGPPPPGAHDGYAWPPQATYPRYQ